MREEIWKPIKDYEGLYEVSNYGNVRSLFRYKKQLKLEITKNGYLRIMLCKNKRRKRYLIHRLVAMTFIPNPSNLPYINHRDENTMNNCVDNLEWCSAKYNCNYGNRNKKIGEKAKIKIIQLDKNNDYVGVWNSIKEASDFFKVSSSAIVHCLKNKNKTCGGYIWRYVEERGVNE